MYIIRLHESKSTSVIGLCKSRWLVAVVQSGLYDCRLHVAVLQSALCNRRLYVAVLQSGISDLQSPKVHVLLDSADRIKLVAVEKFGLCNRRFHVAVVQSEIIDRMLFSAIFTLHICNQEDHFEHFFSYINNSAKDFFKIQKKKCTFGCPKASFRIANVSLVITFTKNIIV